MARRVVGRRFERTKRGNVWFSLTGQTGPIAITAGNNVLLSSLNAAALALRPFTIVRTRGIVRWSSDQIAANEDPFGAVAAIVVSDSASAAGVGSIPTPITQSNADFFVYQPISTNFTFVSAVGVDADGGSVSTFDSKAMRKVGIDDDIAWVAENANAADGASIVVIGRMLVKLL